MFNPFGVQSGLIQVRVPMQGNIEVWQRKPPKSLEFGCGWAWAPVQMDTGIHRRLKRYGRSKRLQGPYQLPATTASNCHNWYRQLWKSLDEQPPPRFSLWLRANFAVCLLAVELVASLKHCTRRKQYFAYYQLRTIQIRAKALE